MKKKQEIYLQASSLVEVLVAFSILGICIAIAASLLNHTMFATFRIQAKQQKAATLAQFVMNDTVKSKMKWTEKDVYCTKSIERVNESGRIVKVTVKCYYQDSLILQRSAYQQK